MSSLTVLKTSTKLLAALPPEKTTMPFALVLPLPLVICGDDVDVSPLGIRNDSAETDMMEKDVSVEARER